MNAKEALIKLVQEYGIIMFDEVRTIIKALVRLEELEKDYEMERTLRIRLENINYEQARVLSFIKEHVLLDGSILRANFQWNLDIEENGKLLKEYLK